MGLKLLRRILLFLLLPLCLAAAEIEEFSAPFEPDLLLHKSGFSLGYSNTYRQALWVSYTLTAEHLQIQQIRRRDRFKTDPEVKRNPVRPRDYAGSGYDKGHLAPAADMTYSVQSMNSSFLMSNISPQHPGCNRGIWKRLEHQVRQWAVKEGKILVVTGPVFSAAPAVAGKSAIPVPSAPTATGWITTNTPPGLLCGSNWEVHDEHSNRQTADQERHCSVPF